VAAGLSAGCTHQQDDQAVKDVVQHTQHQGAYIRTKPYAPHFQRSIQQHPTHQQDHEASKVVVHRIPGTPWPGQFETLYTHSNTHQQDHQASKVVVDPTK
jgi:meiotically up-regulated gene 157 (Mug157) protein